MYVHLVYQRSAFISFHLPETFCLKAIAGIGAIQYGYKGLHISGTNSRFLQICMQGRKKFSIDAMTCGLFKIYRQSLDLHGRKIEI